MRPLLLAMGLAALAAGVSSSAGAQSVSFAGTWKLNVKDSDDPRERMRIASEPVKDPSSTPSYATGRRTAPPRDMGAGGRARGGAGGAGGPGQSGAGPGEGCGPMARLQRPPEGIVVDQTDSTIVIQAGEQCGAGTVFLVSRTTSEPLPNGGAVVNTHSGLKGSKLEVERKLDEETTLLETYTLDAKKGRLVAEYRATTPNLPRTLRIKLVYDRQP